MKIRIFVFGSMLALVLGLMASIAYAAQPSEGSRFYAIMQCKEIDIQEGSVIGQGARVAERCLVSTPIGVGALVPDGMDPISIRWGFDEQCRAIITKIGSALDKQNTLPGQGTIQKENHTEVANPISASELSGSTDLPVRPFLAQLWIGIGDSILEPLGILPSTAYANIASTHNHNMWIKSTILEQFGVTATETFTELDYTQNSSSIYNGRNPSGWCYTSAFPGWRINSCSANYTSSAPVEKWIYGDFENPPTNVSYVMYSKVTAVASGLNGTCFLTEGALPIFWDDDCAIGGS